MDSLEVCLSFMTKVLATLQVSFVAKCNTTKDVLDYFF